MIHSYIDGSFNRLIGSLVASFVMAILLVGVLPVEESAGNWFVIAMSLSGIYCPMGAMRLPLWRRG